MATIATSLRSTVKLADGTIMPLFGLGMYLNSSTGEDCVCHALKSGYRLVDTAEFYGNEEAVGAGIRKSGVNREDIFVVTKLWDLGYDRCKSAFRESLRKLGTGYVDLYLLHSPREGLVVESYKAMLELQKEGLIKSVGVSNFNIHHLEGMKKAGLPTPTVNQFELHAYLRRAELVEYCKKNNIAVMGYSPLCKGKRFDQPELIEMSKRLGKSMAALLIRFSVQMGYITIPKTEKLARIEENAQVFDWEIPQADMDKLNSLPEGSVTWNPLVWSWKG